jgi:hypothetical protein
MKVSLATFLLFMTPTLSWSLDSSLTPQDVFNKFPLCSILSSYGQRCKFMSPDKASSFTPSRIANLQKVDFKDDSVEITTDDWNYSFSISDVNDLKARLTFSDDARLATYLTTVDYNLEWQEIPQNWFIVSRVVTFIRGSEEDKKVEGVLNRYSVPIPFIESK